MNAYPFLYATRRTSEDEAELAVQLRRLAADIERGEISTVLVTAIRRDGTVESIGDQVNGP